MAHKYEVFMSNSAAIAESAAAVVVNPTPSTTTADLMFVGGIQSPDGGWVAAGTFTSEDVAHIMGR